MLARRAGRRFTLGSVVRTPGWSVPLRLSCVRTSSAGLLAWSRPRDRFRFLRRARPRSLGFFRAYPRCFWLLDARCARSVHWRAAPRHIGGGPRAERPAAKSFERRLRAGADPAGIERAEPIERLSGAAAPRCRLAGARWRHVRTAATRHACAHRTG